MPSLSKKISFKFLKGKKKISKKDEVDSSMCKRAKDTDIECIIYKLDSTYLTFFIEKKALGKLLEDYTFHQIEIMDDKNYFGLQYTDKNGINHWLDMTKQVRKQCDVGPPYKLRFQVKFFSSDPTGQMNDEFTRYMFVLQLKQMIRDGELSCQDLDLASDLAALQLQGELGDYNEMEHNPLLISQYRFLPESQQTEEFELLVLEKYSKLKNKNMVPSMSDRQYLEKCRSLPDYGVGRHKIKDTAGKDYVLGLTPTGILIYEGNEKIGLFPWNQVTKLSFKRNRFKIVVQDVQENEQGEIEHFFVFQSEDESACKQLWKSCVENHAFYRLEGAHKPPTKLQQLFRLKSRFYASFHTEYQMAMKNTYGSGLGRGTTFQRASSVRLAPRASFERNEAERRKIQQKYRDQVRTESKEITIRNMNSVEMSDSNASTPVASPKIMQPLLSSSKMDPTANVSEGRLPRMTSQDSTLTKNSTISRQSSEDTVVSESSDIEEIQSNNHNSTKNINDAKSSDKVTSDKPRKGSKRLSKSRTPLETNKEEIICV